MANYLQRTKLIAILAKPYEERTQQEINDSEYYMNCLNPNLGVVEPDEKKKVIQELCKFITIECYKSDELIYQQGQEADKFYLVLEGEVGGYLQNEGEQNVLVNLVRIKESFGQKALTYNKPRLRTMIAQKDTILGVLIAQDFQKILKKHFSIQESQQINFLWELNYLRKLDFKKVKMLHSACSYEKYTADQYVYKEGVDLAQHVYIIKSGTFAIHKKIRPSINETENNQNEKISILAQLCLKPQNKKICIMNEKELFGIEDIFNNTLKRSYSVQCHSNDGELFVISKELFNIIIMEEQTCAKLVTQLNKQYIKRMEAFIGKQQMYYTSDSINSTPNRSDSFANSPNFNISQENPPLNSSLFQRRMASNNSNQEQQISLNQGDNNLLQINTQKTDENISNMNENLKRNNENINQYLEQKKSYQYRQVQNNSGFLQPITLQEERRKSQTPGQITQDLISALYMSTHKKYIPQSSSDLQQLMGSPLLSAKSLQVNQNFRNRVKSSVNMKISDGGIFRSESSFSDIDSEYLTGMKRASDNISTPRLISDNELKANNDHNQDELPKSQFSQQTKLGIYSLSHLSHEDDNFELNRIPFTKKKSHTVLNQSHRRESLEEIASDDDDEQKQQSKKQIHLVLPDIQANQQLTKQNSNPNYSSLQYNNNQQERQNNNYEILSHQQLTDKINAQNNFEEDQNISRIKQNINQHQFVSCYSYLPSINTSFFMKKNENPIDSMVHKHSQQQKYTPIRICQFDQQQQSNNKLPHNQSNETIDDNYFHDQNHEQQEIKLQRSTQSLHYPDFNKITQSHQQHPVCNSEDDKIKINTFGVPISPLKTNNPENSKFNNYYYHNANSKKANWFAKNNQPINQSASQLNSSVQQFAQIQNSTHDNQNKMISQQSLDKNSISTKNRHSLSQEKQVRSSSTPNQLGKILSTQINPNQNKSKKPTFLLGDKPKKEVIGVFNPNFFTTLKGQFIRKFTYNPQIFKDIQAYKFEDFLKKHLKEGPLFEYIGRKGSVESHFERKKEQDDYKKTKDMVNKIRTDALDNLQLIHRKQIQNSQQLDNKKRVISTPQKLQSVNITQQTISTQQQIGRSPFRNSVVLQNTSNNLQLNQNQPFNRQRNYQPQTTMHHRQSNSQSNIQLNLSQNYINQSTFMPISSFHQSQNKQLSQQTFAKKKKKQLNFIISSSGLINQKPPSRLHSINNIFNYQNMSQI